MPSYARQGHITYADLPWSQVVLPTTSAGISAWSVAFLVEGTWVFGYFRDGADCQA